MAEDASPDAAPVSGEVAAIAAEAQTTAAETAGHVAAVAAATEIAVEQIAEDVEDEIGWLKGKFQTHETMLQGIASTLETLPGTIATAMRDAMSEALKSLTPPPSTAETIIPAAENPAQIVEESAAPVSPKKKIKYL